MIGLHFYRRCPDHRTTAFAIAKDLMRNPNVVWGPIAQETESRDQVVVEFAQAQESEFVEFNIWLWQAAPSGEGCLAHQFAERAYGQEVRPYLKQLEGRRTELRPKVLAFEFPALEVPATSRSNRPTGNVTCQRRESALNSNRTASSR